MLPVDFSFFIFNSYFRRVHTLLQYLNSLHDPAGLLRTLGEIEVCRNSDGRLCYTAGNSAVVFKIRHEGRLKSLRCYTSAAPNRAAIYGDRLLGRELFVYNAPDRGEWVDVVVDEWIEGTTLSEAIAAAAETRDRTRLTALSAAFDRLGLEMLRDEWAHGDLKPENIIVTPCGELRLIDFDAAFLPAFAGMTSPELGTAAFRHPTRTASDFDTSLDDYPIALISTALHALALDPALYDRYRDRDGLLFDPPQIARDFALREVLALFERRCLGLRYRIARLLLAPVLRLLSLKELLHSCVNPPNVPDTVPELFASEGLWGYRTPCETVIPPLYDCGFDFTEGLAAVRLGGSWHFIDTAGRQVVDASAYQSVKPFRNGRARVVRDGRKLEIDRSGHEESI